MISIVVPVYNTEKYLDKCIQSILHQTYTDMEIIFINDGSTDRSLQILEKYQAQDTRIQIISVENGGQGKARNIGIERATGEFIMFVDSDDWINERCVETLYYPMKNMRYDIVIGDVVQMQLEHEDVQFVFEQDLDDVIEKSNKKKNLFKIQMFAFAKLYRKSLFVEHGISFPECYFEDIATIPLLCAVADTICFQREVVYHYRCWKGSTVHNAKFIYDRIRCLSILEDELRRLNFYEQYKDEFTAYALQRSTVNRIKAKELLEEQYGDFERRQFMFDYQHFGIMEDVKEYIAYTYGSYNLMISAKILLHLKDEESVPNYFGFQNIISCMSQKIHVTDEIQKVLANSMISAFRKVVLAQDFEKHLLSREPGQICNIDYFILDFLEERYDTGRIGNKYFTLSDVFMDVVPLLHMEYNVTKKFETEWEGLWYENCDSFIRFLKSLIAEEQIILVKMKLAEKYIKDENEYFFAGIEAIRNVNGWLEKCYKYFQRQCPKALVVEVDNLESYYTDGMFRHGCFPWHLNHACYRAIAQEIKKKIDFQRYEQMLLEESQKGR